MYDSRAGQNTSPEKYDDSLIANVITKKVKLDLDGRPGCVSIALPHR